jgi:PAS domain S-box-containing protein
MPQTKIPDSLLLLTQTGHMCVGQGTTHRWEVLSTAGALTALLGDTPVAAPGADMAQIAPDDDRTLVRLFEEVIEGGRGLTRPLRLLHAEGRVFWCVGTAAPSETPGAVELLLRPLTGWDITEHASEAPSAMVENKDFYRRIVETVHDGLLVNAPDGKIVFLNQRLASMLGYEMQELKGVPILALMDEEEQRATRARLAKRKGGDEEVFDCKWQHRSGRAVWTQTAAKPLIDAEGHHLGSVVALMDITQRKATEDALQQLTEELEARVEARTQELEHEVAVRRTAEKTALAASRAKSTFLANMSHELRTPLNAIIGYVELLMEDMEDIPELGAQSTQDLNRIRHSASHLLELISGVLDLSRVEAGRVSLDLRDVAPAEVISMVASSVEGLVERGGNKLVIDMAPALPVLETDITKLRQILLNGLSNASKFTRNGTITLRAFYDAPAADVVFIVQDSGEGISAEALTRIFEPFMQEDSSSTRRVDGAGLGLAISRQFADLLGGALTLQSVKHQGTMFTLRLPLRAPQPKALSEESSLSV